LYIFPLTLPPLRERREDIPLLATHFIQKYAKKMGRNIQGMSHQAMQEMMSYKWYGNIRELEHCIERCVILCKTKMIQTLDLPQKLNKKTADNPQQFVVKSWAEQERSYILEVLKLTNGNVKGKGGAAELLELPPTTLQSKMNKMGIKRKHFLPQ
jgi:formate hydrogenlyase transcriptional activator